MTNCKQNIILKNPPQIKGDKGDEGPKGDSSYLYIRYAEDSSGTGISSTPDVSRPYIGILTTTSPTNPGAGDFDWILFVGPDGNDGEDGTKTFVYIAYADDNSGTGFTNTFDETKDYIAVLTTTTEILNPTASDFTGLWKKYNGVDGSDGSSFYGYIAYADDALGNGFSNTFNASKTHIAILSTDTEIISPVASDFTGLWTKYLGEDGDDGREAEFQVDGNNLQWRYVGEVTWNTIFDLTNLQGTDGVDGQDVYLYIAYADSITGTGFTTTFNDSKDYIGIIKSTVPLTPVATDFTNKWVKYKGESDRYTTTSNTSITIGLGTVTFTVETGLAYSTGQQIVAAKTGDYTFRMQGFVQTYSSVTGQLVMVVTDTFNSGTVINDWSIALSGAPQITSLPQTQTFNGDEAKTDFTISSTADNPIIYLVDIGGVAVDKRSYSVSGKTVTFTSPPPGTTVSIHFFENTGVFEIINHLEKFIADKIYTQNSFIRKDRELKILKDTVSFPYSASSFNGSDWFNLQVSSLRKNITEVGHGLSQFEVVTYKSGEFSKFTTGDTILGIISEVIDTDKFVLHQLGYISGLSGLTENDKYYAQSDGSIGTTVTNDLIGLAISSTELYVISNVSTSGGGGGGGGSSPAIADTYADIDTLKLAANQDNQEEGQVFEVTDASDDPDVDSGKAWYKLGANKTESLSDYTKISEEEAFSENILNQVVASADYELNESSGTSIQFDKARKYGYPTAITSSLTFDFNNAIEGVTQIVRHNNTLGNEPTLPSSAIVLGGAYVLGVNNYIYLTPILASTGPDVWEVHVSYNRKLN